MACNVVRSPFLRNATVRHYAVAALAQCTPEVEIQGSKVAVAAVDNNSPITQVSIIFRAGSRNETYGTQGTAHHLRIAAGLSSCRSTQFGIIRNIQQLGGNITATSDREYTSYTLQITRNEVDNALKFLEDVATQQVFKPWELSDQIPRLRYELSRIPDTARVIELLHKAAYRKGLGYSLYCPKRQLGKINTETLQHFVNTWYTEPKCAVVATGISLPELTSFASNLNINSGDNAIEPAKYGGGEIRKERTSSLSTVALAVESASVNQEKVALAFAILQKAAGNGPYVKWGSSVGALQRDISSIAKDSAAIASFNVSYSDTGLFGIILCAEPGIMEPLTKAAAKWLRSPKVSDADITRGKNILKAEVLYNADEPTTFLQNLGEQILFKSRAVSVSSLIADIDKITTADIQSVVEKLHNKKLSLAAIGDLSCVPHLDELN